MTEFSSDRKPFAVANWKMAMTVAESQAFLRQFRDHLGDVAASVDVVLCPPYTASSRRPRT